MTPQSGAKHLLRAPRQLSFAFFLSGANETDISKLLDIKNEKTPIDQLYSGYSDG